MPLLSRRPALCVLLAAVGLFASSCVDADPSFHDVGGADPLDMTEFVDDIDVARQSRAESRQSRIENRPDDLAFVDGAIADDTVGAIAVGAVADGAFAANGPVGPEVDDGDGHFGAEEAAASRTLVELSDSGSDAPDGPSGYSSTPVD